MEKGLEYEYKFTDCIAHFFMIVHNMISRAVSNVYFVFE